MSANMGLYAREELPIETDDQTWVISWHPPPTAPLGRPEGSSGVCVTDTGEIVIISTREIVTQLGSVNLDDVMEADRLRVILVDEGLAHSQPEGFLKTYLGLTKGQCLMVFGLTHPYHHVGEIDVIASLLGVEF